MDARDKSVIKDLAVGGTEFGKIVRSRKNWKENVCRGRDSIPLSLKWNEFLPFRWKSLAIYAPFFFSPQLFFFSRAVVKMVGAFKRGEGSHLARFDPRTCRKTLSRHGGGI